MTAKFTSPHDVPSIPGTEGWEKLYPYQYQFSKEDPAVAKSAGESGVVDFDFKTPVCFTLRQKNLMQQLINIKSKQQAASVITELLNAPLRV